MEFDLKREISLITPELVELRRDLHRHPELAFNETRTAQVIAAASAPIRQPRCPQRRKPIDGSGF